ncbi:tetratricopeptide repeat protein [Corallococcus sp. CA053C]|uniref:tetratricopeptide repeat protein n=1 Tax=Corallococcus sp. CA053C TaxID=2316732 RepID=UPI000EA23011|nr:tetratricopeptide repeat protein [Corallococcus sp. CA053C]RKH13618.1 tetratricopeptide repeat protein [Corallococcus sp. CA053C]
MVALVNALPFVPGGVLLVEAPRGRARTEALRQLQEQARGQGGTCWLLECDRDEGGPWAGLSDLMTDLVPEVQARAPELVLRYDYELVLVVPELQRTVTVRNPTLTDISPEAERTRNYAADRAYRIGHGLIDLLDAWRPRSDGKPWVIICDNFERGGALVRQFFADLMRRRGKALNVKLVLAVAPGMGDLTRARFDASTPLQRVTPDLPADPPAPPVDPKEMAAQARALAPEAPDMAGLERVLPRLIRAWQRSDEPQRALLPLMQALSTYTTRGMYEDAILYGEAALANLERHCPEALDKRMAIYMKLVNCYAGLGRSAEGLQVAEKAMTLTDEPAHLYRWCYILSMFHARYLPKRDLALAEQYLEKGRRYIQQADLPLHTRLFQTAFNRNGLALVRHFQKRYSEAISLCNESFAELNQHLGPDEHLLHRSVLLYNVGQVYSTLGRQEDAIQMYTEAIRMDPNYSEYYNDRGSLYLKLERWAEAERDFLKAIELSPPYMEVLTNLGQCYRLQGRLEEALRTLSHSLDLLPQQVIARVHRGQVYETQGRPEEALVDYDVALALDDTQGLVFASRAVLHYEAGRIDAALVDLDRALTLEPEMADLYQNRSVALAELGRLADAERDLHTYLRLSPAAEDRPEVEQKLVELQARMAAA